MDFESVRIALVAAAMMDLQVIAGDISSAYIQAETCEKVYTIAGPEFGLLQGRKLIIYKALYGLKSSGGMWHHKLADTLREIGFTPSKADFDLWIREREKIIWNLLLL